MGFESRVINVMMTANLDIKNWTNLCVLVYQRQCVLSAWYNTIPKSIIHVLTSSVVHSFGDGPDESCFFAYNAKLLFWSDHLEPLLVFAPAVSRRSLCSVWASYQRINFLRIQLLWQLFVFFWNGNIHSSRYLILHSFRQVCTPTRHSCVDTELICWVSGAHH